MQLPKCSKNKEPQYDEKNEEAYHKDNGAIGGHDDSGGIWTEQGG